MYVPIQEEPLEATVQDDIPAQDPTSRLAHSASYHSTYPKLYPSPTTSPSLNASAHQSPSSPLLGRDTPAPLHSPAAHQQRLNALEERCLALEYYLSRVSERQSEFSTFILEKMSRLKEGVEEINAQVDHLARQMKRMAWEGGFLNEEKPGHWHHPQPYWYGNTKPKTSDSLTRDRMLRAVEHLWKD